MVRFRVFDFTDFQFWRIRETCSVLKIVLCREPWGGILSGDLPASGVSMASIGIRWVGIKSTFPHPPPSGTLPLKPHGRPGLSFRLGNGRNESFLVPKFTESIE